MKLLVALLLFLFFNFNFQKVYSRVAKVSSSEVGTCFSCKIEGQVCIPSELHGFGDCADGLVCGTDSNDASLQRYICQEPSLDGCVDRTVCDIGLLCDFSETQHCSDIKFAGIGEKCIKDLDCSGSNVKCQEGICISNSSECLTFLDCKGSETCDPNSGKCIQSIQLGSQCKQDYECGSLSFCSNITNKCTLLNSLKDGEKCYSDTHCQTGSACSNGLCSQGVLISSSEDKFSNCSLSTDSTCELGSYCDCQSGLCKMYPKHPNKIFIDRMTCIKNNNCQVVDNLFSKSSCFTKNCKHVEIESFKDNICKNTIFEINYRNIEQQETGTSTFLHINAILLSTIFIFAFLLNYEI